MDDQRNFAQRQQNLRGSVLAEQARYRGEDIDRGACPKLTFTRCQRGFTLEAFDMYYGLGRTWAFERIEDLASWLIEQYGEAPNRPSAKA